MEGEAAALVALSSAVCLPQERPGQMRLLSYGCIQRELNPTTKHLLTRLIRVFQSVLLSCSFTLSETSLFYETGFHMLLPH